MSRLCHDRTVIVAREGVNTLNQFDFTANPRYDSQMIQSFGGIGGLFAHASNLQISPYLKATRLIQILLDSGAECGLEYNTPWIPARLHPCKVSLSLY